MGTTITANMSLVLANPAGSSNPEPGPQYAADNNESFTILDSHNHSPGSGVQITPAGLNINTNLTFQNNNATNVYGVAFSAPTSSSQLSFLYTAPNAGGGIFDLFFNDGAGNVIDLTKAGAVNATIASIPGESYAGGTFTWKQGAGSTTPANFDIGSITIRPNVAATTYGVVLGPPSGISSQYNVQLPIVPGSTSIMTLDSSGNMLATLVPDNSSIVISSNTLEVGAKGITQGMLANRSSGSTVGAGGVAISSSCGTFTNAGGATQITNLSVTITTTGRPVFVSVQSDGTTNNCYIGATFTLSGTSGVFAVATELTILNGATSIAQYLIEHEAFVLNTETLANYIPVSFGILDTSVGGSPGTYTYTAQLANANAGTSSCNNAVLVAYEI